MGVPGKEVAMEQENVTNHENEDIVRVNKKEGLFRLMSVQQSQTVIFANKQRQYEQGKLEITWISEVTSAGVEMTVK